MLSRSSRTRTIARTFAAMFLFVAFAGWTVVLVG